MNYLKLFFKILQRTILIILLLVLLLYGLLHLSFVQTWLVKKVADDFSERLHTKVAIKKVDIAFFNKLLIEGVYVEDRQKDTLLYAGQLKVNLTDWFFLKDKVVLSYVSLKDACIYTNRQDSVWNYQFIIDYFDTPSTGKKKKKNIELDLKEVHLTNIRFQEKDKWLGRDMFTYTSQLNLIVDELNPLKKKIGIHSIEIESPIFEQSDYDGLRPPKSNTEKTVNQISDLTQTKLNEDGWLITINHLSINKGIFKTDRQTDRANYTHFDGQHILFSNIDASINNLKIADDTLRADIELATKERSGLEVKQLRSSIRFTPEIMEFNKLRLTTNNSELGDYYAMHFSSFNDDMSDYMEKVNMHARFKKSTLSSTDLAYFAPAVKQWNRSFHFSGEAKGTVQNIAATNVLITTGNSSFNGNVILKGLPEINTTYAAISANKLQTNFREAALLIPVLRSIKEPNVAALGNVTFKGNFKGNINKFSTNGFVQTNLGNIATHFTMKIPDKGIPSYSGTVNTEGFNLGHFIGTKQISNIALNGAINGKGFTLKHLNTYFNGNINRIGWNGYNYANISIKGNFINKIFTGHLEAKDPNLKIKGMDGSLTLSGKEMMINANADIEYVNLKNLQLANRNLSFSGLLNVNFTGNNIDNFLGTARIYDAQLLDDNTLLSFDYFTLNSAEENNIKTLSISSNEVDAAIYGKFSILSLPESFKYFLNRYYPIYISKPTSPVVNQDFSFDIKTRAVEDFLKLIDNRLGGLNDSHIYGKLNVNNSLLTLNGNIPELIYDNKVFTNIKLIGSGNRDSLTVQLNTENIKITDSLQLPSIDLHLQASNDISKIKVKTSAGNVLNDAELNASVQTLEDGIKLTLDPSSFVLNEKRWNLEKGGEIVIRKNFLHADELKLKQENQEITIGSELSEENNENNIVAKLSAVEIGEILPYITANPKVEGKVSGKALIQDPFGKLRILFNGSADSTSLDGNYIGKINLETDANISSGVIKFRADTKEEKNDFTINGVYNLDDDSLKNPLKIDLLAKKIRLQNLQPYLQTIFDEIDGIANTNLTLSGKPEHLFLTGEAIIDTGSVKVGYTQCRYRFANEKIIFREDEIDIDRIRIADSLNNTGVISGKMHHEFFQKFRFDDIRFETAKLLLLNTTKKHNQQFYGTVIGNANMRLNGPMNNMVMDITGAPSILDSSRISLPSTAGKESNVIDYIDFIQFGRVQNDQKGKDITNFIVNLNINANASCTVDVILDETTGDIIKGNGRGLINIRVGNREPLSIRGRYDIEKGEYKFNFQTFLQKPFNLNRGYITWNGDPYQANLNIEAEYIAKNVDVSMINSAGGYRQKEDITIVSYLRGVLQKPDIQFEFRLPEKSAIKNDYIATKKLADYQNDKTEMNKQVASLLLFNSFLSSQSNFLSYENTITFATNTIGGVISGWLTNVLNKQLEKATNGVLTTYIDINPTLNLQTTANQLQANIRAGVKLLLSKRLLFLVGGNIEYNNPAALQLARRGMITPDLSIEWILNSEGSLRVVGFNRSSIDLTIGQRNRSGMQLTYRKEYDRFWDFFKSRKRINAEALERHNETNVKILN